MNGRVAMTTMGQCGYGCPQPMPEFVFEIGARLYFDGVLVGKVVAVDRVGDQLVVTSEIHGPPGIAIGVSVSMVHP